MALDDFLNKEEVEEGAPAWVMTMGDLNNLLLCFFVLLVAFSSIEEKKFGRAIGSLRGALGSFGGMLLSDSQEKGSAGLAMVKTAERKDDISVPTTQEEGKESVDFTTSAASDFYQKVKKQIQESAGAQHTEIGRVKDGIAVKVSADLLFKKGSAKLVPAAKDYLDMFGSIVKSCENAVSIEGHTDNIPVDERAYFGWGKGLERYTSNWDLSVARAVVVVEYLIKQKGVSQGRLKATGFADTQPVASNTTDEGRKKNRRVVLILLDPERKVTEVSMQTPRVQSPGEVQSHPGESNN